jgi:hypothetical protein
VVLAPGASASYGGLVVRLVAVTSDSRCPANAICIQQGDALMDVEARANGATTTYTLQVNDPAKRSAVHAGYRIDVDMLTPYPFTTPIPQADYRLTLTLRRN